jgi:acyl-coenzyme A synthetase/AMP-(fatty) acid ligase
MMERIPLLGHDSPHAVVAYRCGKAITAQEFLADVDRVSALLPESQHILNACVDRYRFAVGLAACVVRDKISMLPPTLVPEVIRQMRLFAPDVCCLTDNDNSEINLPTIKFPVNTVSRLVAWDVPKVRSDQRVAYVFTSGSTGTPVAHAKTWSRLVDNVRVEADFLGFYDGRQHALVATVPPQHMYGFESTVLVALISGQAFCTERPFFPADIASILAAIPHPRILVSTPIHLRAVLAANVDMPRADLVLCATAPLDPSIAVEIEECFGGQLIEIYGSTETGQIAFRRTSKSAEWRLWPGVELLSRDGFTYAQGGHVEVPTPLGDVLEIIEDHRFILHGRIEDLVNIAGKRSSLAYLNHQLAAISGVVDGAYFLREDLEERSAIGASRLGAVVVAPGVAAEAVMRGLRERVDPVFLPRPLLIVDTIPRNSTGKVTYSALKALIVRR